MYVNLQANSPVGTCLHLGTPRDGEVSTWAGWNHVCVIDRESGVPLYRQLADLLRAKIDSGEYPPGKLLPSELTLQQEHGLARDTVRQALDILRAEGRVVTYPGRGTAVVPEQ